MKEDTNPLETREWLDALDDVVKHEGPERASFLLAGIGQARDGFAPAAAVCHHHAVLQHHRAGGRKNDARRPVHGAPHSLPGALECAGDGDAGQRQRRGPGRPYFQFLLQRHALRRGLQPFFPRHRRRPSGRPGVLPGPQRAGHVCALLPGRAAGRGAAGQLSPRGGWRRPVVLPAPLADARLLAVSHRVHGPWARSRRSTRRAS